MAPAFSLQGQNQHRRTAWPCLRRHANPVYPHINHNGAFFTISAVMALGFPAATIIRPPGMAMSLEPVWQLVTGIGCPLFLRRILAMGLPQYRARLTTTSAPLVSLLRTYEHR